METQHRIVDDLNTPIAAVLTRGGSTPVDLTGRSVEFQMIDSAGVDKVAQTATGVTEHPTTVFTANATATDRLKADNHRLANGTQLLLFTTSTLPGGLAVATIYFVKEAGIHEFKLSATIDGSVVDITDTGGGVHTYTRVGSVQFAPIAADVDTAGKYRAYFIDVTGATDDTFPARPAEFIIQLADK